MSAVKGVRVTEAAFQRAVIELAEMNGWRCYHTHDSRKSPPGFPDLTMVRNGQLVFAEMKREDGAPTDEQRAWLIGLGRVADLAEDQAWITPPLVAVYLWRPSDWPEIEQVLKR